MYSAVSFLCHHLIYTNTSYGPLAQSFLRFMEGRTFSPSFLVEACLGLLPCPSFSRWTGLCTCHLCLKTHWAFRVFVIGRITFEIKFYASSELRIVSKSQAFFLLLLVDLILTHIFITKVGKLKQFSTKPVRQPPFHHRER